MICSYVLLNVVSILEVLVTESASDVVQPSVWLLFLLSKFVLKLYILQHSSRMQNPLTQGEEGERADPSY